MPLSPEKIQELLKPKPRVNRWEPTKLDKPKFVSPSVPQLPSNSVLQNITNKENPHPPCSWHDGCPYGSVYMIHEETYCSLHATHELNRLLSSNGS